MLSYSNIIVICSQRLKMVSLLKIILPHTTSLLMGYEFLLSPLRVLLSTTMQYRSTRSIITEAGQK